MNAAKHGEHVRPAPPDDITKTPEAQRIIESHEEQARGSMPTASPEGVLPLQMYAVPDWLEDYGFQAPQNLGSSGDWFAQKYPQAAATSETERTEYHALVRKHYRELTDRHGLHDTVAHFEAMVNDKTSSEAMRREMADSVRGDDRLMELMEKMGKVHIVAVHAKSANADASFRQASVDQMTALSQDLYDKGEISLQTHAMLSFDPSRGQAVPGDVEGNIFMTAPNAKGQYDWVSEMNARLEFARATGQPTDMLETTVREIEALTG